jgi:hypothetical protein
MINEEELSKLYESLDGEKIIQFIKLVELALNNNRDSNYYELVRSITKNVVEKKSLSLKQFRSMYFFLKNYQSKVTKEKSPVKTF